MSTKIRLEMKPVTQIVAAKGLSKDGEVQRYTTHMVNRRIGRYMPFRSGVLSTKLKHVKGPTEIEVLGPYARYQYYGKVMVGKPPKVATNKDLVYTKTKNPQAGPYWDRALVAAEGDAMRRELQRFINRKAGKV